MEERGGRGDRDSLRKRKTEGKKMEKKEEEKE